MIKNIISALSIVLCGCTTSTTHVNVYPSAHASVSAGVAASAAGAPQPHPPCDLGEWADHPDKPALPVELYKLLGPQRMEERANLLIAHIGHLRAHIDLLSERERQLSAALQRCAAAQHAR